MSFFKLLNRSTQVYLSHWVQWTRPLVLPVVLLVISLIWMLVAPIYWAFTATEWIATNTLTIVLAATWGLALPGFVVFSWGFWRYLVLIAQLCVPARDSLVKSFQPEQCQSISWSLPKLPSKSFRFFLGIYTVVWGTPFILSLPALAGALWIPEPAWQPVWVGLSFLGFGLGLLVSIVLAFLLVLGFQAFAFESESTLKTERWVWFKKSVHATLRYPAYVLFGLMLTGLVTGNLAPWLVNLILDFSGLSHLILMPVLELLQAYWRGVGAGLIRMAPDFNILWGVLFSEAAVARFPLEYLHSVSSSVVTMLLLPWGTVFFTGVYLKAQSDQ